MHVSSGMEYSFQNTGSFHIILGWHNISNRDIVIYWVTVACCKLQRRFLYINWSKQHAQQFSSEQTRRHIRKQIKKTTSKKPVIREREKERERDNTEDGSSLEVEVIHLTSSKPYSPSVLPGASQILPPVSQKWASSGPATFQQWASTEPAYRQSYSSNRYLAVI